MTWDLDPDAPDPTPVLSASQPWAGEQWVSVRRQGGVVTAIPDGGGVVVIDGPDRWELLPGVQVLDAQAVFDGTGELFLGVVADDGSGYVRDARLLYGDPAAPTELPLPFEDAGRNLVPEEVAVGVTDDRVVLVVAGFEASGLGGQDGVAGSPGPAEDEMTARPAFLAGRWYPDEPGECAAVIDAHGRHARPEAGTWRGTIGPHAGWYYSGDTAAHGYAWLAAAQPEPDLVVVFGSHRGRRDRRRCFVPRPGTPRSARCARRRGSPRRWRGSSACPRSP